VSFVEIFIEEEGKQQAAATGGGGEGTGRTGAVESIGGFRFSKRKIITECVFKGQWGKAFFQEYHCSWLVSGACWRSWTGAAMMPKALLSTLVL
jgi:hypothetical protein